MRIVISGTVGIGKSTTAKNLYDYLLNKEVNVSRIDELADGYNPYLRLFYENRPEWSFLTQMDFLTTRYRTLVEENDKHLEESDRVAIFDRHFLDDMIFTSMDAMKDEMSMFQYNLYKNTNMYMAEKINTSDQPDYFIILKASFDNVMSRVSKRGREEELKVDLAYWEDMYDKYYSNESNKEYLEENTKKLIVLDIDGMSEEEVLDKILEITDLK